MGSKGVIFRVLHYLLLKMCDGQKCGALFILIDSFNYQWTHIWDTVIHFLGKYICHYRFTASTQTDDHLNFEFHNSVWYHFWEERLTLSHSSACVTSSNLVINCSWAVIAYMFIISHYHPSQHSTTQLDTKQNEAKKCTQNHICLPHPTVFRISAVQLLQSIHH